MEYTGIPGCRADSSDPFNSDKKWRSCQRLTVLKQYMPKYIIFHTTFRASIQAIVKIKSSALTYSVKSTVPVFHHQYTLALPRALPMHLCSVV